jgi:hypothetical protein
MQAYFAHPQCPTVSFTHFPKDKVCSYRVWPSNWLDVLSIEHRKDVYR